MKVLIFNMKVFLKKTSFTWFKHDSVCTIKFYQYFMNHIVFIFMYVHIYVFIYLFTGHVWISHRDLDYPVSGSWPFQKYMVCTPSPSMGLKLNQILFGLSHKFCTIKSQYILPAEQIYSW